jgi:hypothetical protein
MMNWKEFKESEPHWLDIAKLLRDRIELIKLDLATPDKTASLLHVRVLQQELLDILFMLNLPDKLAEDTTEKGTDDGELAANL